MALTPPTPDALITRYPVFKGTDTGLITAILQEALGAVDETWIPTDQQPALLAYAAHLLMIEKAGAQSLTLSGGASLMTSGPLTSVNVDGLSASFSDGASSALASQFPASNGLASTVYGRRYLELLRRNKPPVAWA